MFFVRVSAILTAIGSFWHQGSSKVLLSADILLSDSSIDSVGALLGETDSHNKFLHELRMSLDASST